MPTSNDPIPSEPVACPTHCLLSTDGDGGYPDRPPALDVHIITSLPWVLVVLGGCMLCVLPPLGMPTLACE